MPAIEFTPVTPYSLERTIGAFARFPDELVDCVHSSGFRRAFETANGIVLLQASQPAASDLCAPVTIEVLATAGAPETSRAIHQLSHQIALSEPIQPVYTLMQSHPTLAPLAHELQGLRRTLDPTPFEGLVSSILAQLISIRGAAVIRSRFVRRYGQAIQFDGDDYWVFPDPNALRGATIDELCGLGMTGTKARAIQTVANLCVTGELGVDRFANQDDASVMGQLVALPGIGPWTAEWFLVNVLGRMSIVPSSDLGIRRATGKWLAEGAMPPASEVRRIYEPFGEIKAYIAYYVLSAERYDLQPPC